LVNQGSDKLTKVTFYLEKDLAKLVKHAAVEKDMTISEFGSSVLSKAVNFKTD